MARKQPGRRPDNAGAIRQLASGRWQVRYRDDEGRLKPAPQTFDTRLDAAAWLNSHAAGDLPPERPRVRFGDYAERFLATRDLKPRTRSEYTKTYRTHVEPAFADVMLDRITPSTVRTWHATLDPERATARAHAYSLLRTILNAALADDLITTNPCRIRGAGNAKTSREIVVASLPELEVIAQEMPDRLRLMVLLAAWCGLRYGELVGLTRADLSVTRDESGQPVAGTVTVRRGVVRLPGEYVVDTPKTRAGLRTVAIPPHLLPEVEWHLDHHVLRPVDSPVFSNGDAGRGGFLAEYTLRRAFHTARMKADRPDLRFHDLRHTGATLAAATGATLADLMARIGHATPAMALRYQHTVAGRDRAIAEALSGLAAGAVVPLPRRV